VSVRKIRGEIKKMIKKICFIMRSDSISIVEKNRHSPEMPGGLAERKTKDKSPAFIF
jgi:hypothetical protein